MAVHRRLCFASMHTGLDGFFTGRKASTARVAAWGEMGDYRYRFWHRLARIDPLAPAYTDRTLAANGIAVGSVKLQ